ncbi:MAG TPA: CAP domain-containing protein, partial [Caldilineaceae bacterium]|nr:CAP domain-containing protein [Caldilineaceae bacterium]
MNPRFTLLSAAWRTVAPVVCLLLTLWPSLARAEDPPAAPAGLSAEAQAIADAINQRRADAGLSPLGLNPLLTQAAQGHVDDMINNGAYGHIGSDGSYVGQRVQRVGYSSGGLASENWVSAVNPSDAMTWWMNDWIHRENILNPRWQEVGVGASTSASGRMIFVTVFAAGNGAGGQSAVIPAVTREVQQAPGNSIDYAIQPGDTLIAIA